MSGKEPDVDHPSTATVARVHALASEFDRAVVCCDSGRSFRKDIADEYKANRPERDERLIHQLKIAQETLGNDGFAVWAVKGFEADDVIASAVAWAAKNLPIDHDENEIVVGSSDKDLLQLAGGNVRIKSLTSGALLDADGVKEKFGVTPAQLRDWLVLVGDQSDNIKGIPGVGAKRATAILQAHGSLVELFAKLDQGAEALDMTPAIYKALSENVAAAETGRKLVTLRTDVQLPFEDMLKPRVTKPIAASQQSFDEEDDDTNEEDNVSDVIDGQTGEVTTETEPQQKQLATTEQRASVTDLKPAAKTKESAPASAELIVRPPSWDLALEPTNAGAAYKMAAHIYNSRLFSNMPNEDAVFAVILMGRTLGIDALTMLRNVHVIEGKITLAAPLIVGLVLKSGKADYFKCIESTNDKAVYKTHRKGDPDPEATVFEYTIEDAKRQMLLMPIEPGKKPGNWHKTPKTMLRHRCSTELARAIYPDVTSGLYSPDEFGVDVRVEESAA
jgi:5'-3' exonuclease